jgi:hypothetical protein
MFPVVAEDLAESVMAGGMIGALADGRIAISGLNGGSMRSVGCTDRTIQLYQKRRHA